MSFKQIRFENVWFRYDGGRFLFENLTFALPDVPLIWIKANPGQGKSTLLKILAGLLSPEQGGYYLDDLDVTQLSFKEFLPYRMRIGYSFDMGGLLSNRTLFENLMLPLLFHKICEAKEAEARVKYWMEKFGLSKVADQRPFFVTGGHRKSTIVLRSMIHYPDLLLLDDPMSGLKEDGRAAFTELVTAVQSQGALKKIIFCAERELPVNQSTTEFRLPKSSQEELAA